MNETSWRSSKNNNLWIVTCFAIYTFLLIFNLMNSSLWGDEWIEYTYSQLSISNGNMYRAIIRTFQPPLYNLIMHFWLKINSGILWFRLFNVVCGLISGSCLFKIIRELINEKVACCLIIALGGMYQWVYCIQECSEYALMLVFVFLAFQYYIENVVYNRKGSELLFIFFCVCAIYTQYGAFFIVFPLLLIHLLTNLSKRILIIYIIAFLLFAVPLYLFFARYQLFNNEIGHNNEIAISVSGIFNIPIVFGKLIAYFYNIGDGTVLEKIFIGFGIIIMFCAIYVLLKSSENLIRQTTMVLAISYILFYVLTEIQIYGMIHPNVSAGFYSRYSYFFIPEFLIIIPILLNGFFDSIKCKVKNVLFYLLIIFFAIVILQSSSKILDNWKKSYDKEFAEIWYNNAGFTESTFLVGIAHYGFDYYTSDYNFELSGDILGENDIDVDDLPKRFWIWRTNIGGEIWDEVVKLAKEQGYKVNIYADHGYQGQLAFCYN